MDILFLCRVGNHNTFACLNLNLRHGGNRRWTEDSHAVVVNRQLLNVNAGFLFCLMKLNAVYRLTQHMRCKFPCTSVLSDDEQERISNILIGGTFNFGKQVF